MRQKSSRFARVIAGVLASTLLAAASPATAAAKAKVTPFCASDRDIAALNARVLQTELMVAALSCDQKQRYNTFVTEYQAVLNDRGKALQSMFRRAHGATAETRLNAFITKLANDTSQQVRDKGEQYCVFADQLFDEAMATRPTDINRLTTKPWIESRHGYHSCVMQASRKTAG